MLSVSHPSSSHSPSDRLLLSYVWDLAFHSITEWAAVHVAVDIAMQPTLKRPFAMSAQACLARQDLCHTHLALLLQIVVIIIIITTLIVMSPHCHGEEWQAGFCKSRKHVHLQLFEDVVASPLRVSDMQLHQGPFRHICHSHLHKSHFSCNNTCVSQVK